MGGSIVYLPETPVEKFRKRAEKAPGVELDK